MVGKIIAILHMLFGFFMYFYAFIIKSNFLYDYLYVSLLILLNISWILLNHECPLSCLYKIYYYNNNHCGYTTSLDDLNELNIISTNGKNNILFDNFVVISRLILILFLFISIYLTILRSHIVQPIIGIFVLIFLRYFYILFNNATGYDTNKLGKNILGKYYSIFENIYYDYKLNEMHTIINHTILFILIGFWLYITYKNRHRLYHSIYRKQV